AYAIRGDLREDTERPQASPKIDETTKAELFITPVAGSYVVGSVGSADALEKSRKKN
ncbi:MAG: CRISPR-associated protein Cas7, partial [Saprospiraceae bacterium]|nr:CRISPR-associated protein Cas7 [Saprospiraceae bacterium]